MQRAEWVSERNTTPVKDPWNKADLTSRKLEGILAIRAGEKADT